MLSKKTHNLLKEVDDITKKPNFNLDVFLTEVQKELDIEDAQKKNENRLKKLKETQEIRVQNEFDLHKRKKEFNEEFNNRKKEEAIKCIDPSEITEIDLNIILKPCSIDNIILNDPVDIDNINKLLLSDYLEKNPIYEFDNESDYLNAYRNIVVNNCVAVNYIKNNNTITPINSMAMSLMRNKVINTIIDGNMIGIFIHDSTITILNMLCIRERFKSDKINMVLKNKHLIINNIMNKYNIEHEQANNILLDIINIKNINKYENILDVRITSENEIDNLQSYVDEIEELTFKYFSKKYLTHYVNMNPSNYDTMNVIEKHNIMSSFLINKIINGYEYQILNLTYSYLLKKKLIENNNAVLYKNGILIERANYNDLLLQSLTKNINELMDINIQFILRQLTDKYDLSNIRYIKSDDCLYYEFKTNFEKKYFTLEDSSCYYYVKNYEVIQHKQSGIEKILKGEYGTNSTKFLTRWDMDTSRRKYKNIVFEPNLSKHDDENYNLYDGFIYDKLEYNSNNTSYFLQVLQNIFTEESEYNYFINWVSHIIQFPHKKTKKCIVIYNDVSNGLLRSIMDILLKIFDRYGCFLYSTDIIAKHNPNLDKKFFMYGEDETKTKKYILNKLNDRHITYQDNNDYSNYCIMTNDLNIVSDLVNDTKYYILRFNKNIQFNDTVKPTEELNDDNYLCNIYMHFKKYNVNNELIAEPIRTVFQQNYKFELVPIYKQMIYNNPNDFDGKSLTSLQIYEMSLVYADKINYNIKKMKYTERICMNQLTSFIGELTTIIHGYSTYGFYNFSKFECNDIYEYLKKIDKEYYNYVNNL